MTAQFFRKFFVKKEVSDRTFWYTLGFSTIVTGALGLAIGLRQSLWFDDDYSVELATKSISQLIHLTSIDVHPPTYYLLLKGWGSMFGWNDLAMRSLSILFTMGALVVGGLLIRKMFGNRAAVGAMLLVMIAPLITRYGFEVRMYSLASLIGISATYALYSAWQTRGRTQLRWLVLYGALVALGIWTLYALALLWIAHVVWIGYMAWRRRMPTKQLMPYLVTYIASAIVFLPWLPVFISQLTNGALGPIVEPLKLDQIVGIASFNTIYRPSAEVNVLETALLLAVVGVYMWAIPRAYRQLHAKSGELMLLAMYMGVPIVVMMVVSLAKAMYVERYLSHISIGMILLGGVVLVTAVDSVKKKRWVHYVPYVIVYGAFLVGIYNLASVGNFSYQHQYRPSAREVAANISCPSHGIVLTDTPYTAAEMWFYMQECPVHFISSQDTLRGGDAPLSGNINQVKDVSALTAEHITYISYGQPDKDKFPAAYHQDSTRSFGAMDVTQYSR